MFRIKLPATSANLGPGFDTVGLAMSLWLTVEAELAETWSIEATGRNADICGRVDDSLILSTYRDLLALRGQAATPLRLRLNNEIPLGMGCGSSAAALLAGVALADHFGDLELGDNGIAAEAGRLEGHPDNVMACWHGGFTVSFQDAGNSGSATFGGDPGWRLLLVMQTAALATEKARALLPDQYSRADAVFNIQRTAQLIVAFATRQQRLLGDAMRDRLHQPYRLGACPLLGALLPFAGSAGIAGVALSGAGPSVLIILNEYAFEDEVRERIAEAVKSEVEILSLRIAGGTQRSRT